MQAYNTLLPLWLQTISSLLGNLKIRKIALTYLHLFPRWRASLRRTPHSAEELSSVFPAGWATRARTHHCLPPRAMGQGGWSPTLLLHPALLGTPPRIPQWLQLCCSFSCVLRLLLLRAPGERGCGQNLGGDAVPRPQPPSVPAVPYTVLCPCPYRQSVSSVGHTRDGSGGVSAAAAVHAAQPGRCGRLSQGPH